MRQHSKQLLWLPWLAGLLCNLPSSQSTLVCACARLGGPAFGHRQRQHRRRRAAIVGAGVQLACVLRACMPHSWTPLDLLLQSSRCGPKVALQLTHDWLARVLTHLHRLRLCSAWGYMAPQKGARLGASLPAGPVREILSGVPTVSRETLWARGTNQSSLNRQACR